jgi:hypothetical protein
MEPLLDVQNQRSTTKGNASIPGSEEKKIGLNIFMKKMPA